MSGKKKRLGVFLSLRPRSWETEYQSKLFFISISSTPFLFPSSKKLFFEFVVVTKMLEVDSKMFSEAFCVVTGGMFCVPAIIFFHLFSFFDIHAPIFFVEGEK